MLSTGEELSNHPLVLLARKGVPSAEAQLAKHLDGWYQGIISTKIRVEAVDSEPSANFKFEDVHFGISLLPNQNCAEHKDPNETTTPLSFDILVTPLPQGVDLKIDDNQILGKGRIAIAENDNFKPMKESEASQTDAAQQPKLASPAEDKKKHMEVTTSRPTAKPMARIEDSVDALDKLEEQLEAFDEAAHFRQILSPGAPDSETKAAMQSLSVPSTEAARSKTPQPRRTTPVNAGSAFIRTPSTNEPRRSLRKSASMIFLDKPKLKSEEKPAAHALPKRSSTVKGIASLLPPKQTPKSAKRPTIPTFELPGDEVARKLKEKREARLSTQVAAEQVAKPTVSSLRRAKSARAPTRPNFELPGEAISRRKREEREVQLKAQEEEERKRREFKAKPIRSGAGPSTFPRETVTSRARQNKGQLPENSRQHGTPGSNNASPLTMNSASRSPLSKTNNQTQPRGRGLHPEPFGMQPSRSISSSSTVGSGSGIRSSVSTEEVQQQRIRGQDIYKRDNSWAAEREREKREREALAKLAREEAAERSRQQGREWAAKQARKRMTIASIRDVMA